MSSGFQINRQGIARMTREIQCEFDKHPIRVPIEAQDHTQPGRPSGSTNFYGPVINVTGDRAQLAWNNDTVTQNQTETEQVIAPGFEAIAQAVASTLHQLGQAGLDPDDQAAAEAAAGEVLGEVVNDEPDRGKIRSALAALKGFLSPLALGMHSGAVDGAQEWAKTAIEQLGTPF